jgi:hypothetical protein
LIIAAYVVRGLIISQFKNNVKNKRTNRYTFFSQFSTPSEFRGGGDHHTQSTVEDGEVTTFMVVRSYKLNVYDSVSVFRHAIFLLSSILFSIEYHDFISILPKPTLLFSIFTKILEGCV